MLRTSAFVLCLATLTAWAQTGQLTLYVFNVGSPVDNVEVLVDDELFTLTGANGVAVLSIDAGIHELELRVQDSVVLEQQIIVTQDEVAQWIVDISGGGSALYDVESSHLERIAEHGAAAESVPAAGDPGTLTGSLTSADDGAPIEGARVFISGIADQVRSDAEGRFTIELPAGVYSISVLHPGFNTLTRDNFEVVALETAEADLTLVPSGSELPEFVVIAPYISGSLASVMSERRESDGVTDVLSAEQISRAGDSDAAGALKRVTGLTLVNGQYIYVRGLGERYSSVLLNDATIPSPDPTRRVVPLSLFPTDVIEAVVVQKTAAANLPGDFGGGTVQLRTVSFPPEMTAKLSASLGYRDGTTGDDGLTYEGGDTDWLGIDDGARELPESLAAAIAGGNYLRQASFTNPDGFTPQEMEAFGQDLAAMTNYDVKDKDVPPNVGLSGSFGNSFEFGDKGRWGFITAFKYDNQWANLEEERKEFSAVSGGSGLQLKGDLDVFRTVNYVDTSLFANVGAEFNDANRVGFNAMLLRQSENETKVSEGTDDNQLLQRYAFQWIENELLSYQAVGSHTLPFRDWTIDWQYTDATATREEPNSRGYRRDDDDEDGDYQISTRADSNDQTWSDLEDNLDNWSVDTRLPLDLGNKVLAVSAGASDLTRDRDASIRTFSFTGRIPNELLDQSYEELYTDPFIGPNGLRITETTRPTDTYVATQTLDTLYLNLDVSLFDDQWKISAGLREEDNFQEVLTNDLGNPDAPPVVGRIDQADRLPSAAITWAYSQDAQIRAAYAESLNRPDFRELSPAPYLDPLLDLITVGNPNLVTAELRNYDLRWEYYFSPSESFSVAGFYKEFTNPIEKTFSSSGSGRIITLQNALAAELSGVEFDYSQSLGWVDTFDWLGGLADFEWWGLGALDWGSITVGFNYAWIDSSVDIDPTQTNQTNPNRPLQGASPWVVNFQVGYHDPDSPTEWTLLYNEFGERISQAGVQGQPDVYEQPFPQLDFVYRRNFADHWRFTFKVKNLLNSRVEFTQGDEVTRVFKPGPEVSVDLQWKY